jgi:Fe-S-cluster-containing dehydrogenase component
VSRLIVPLTKGIIAVSDSHCVGCRTCEVVCSLFRGGVCAPELSAIQTKADFLGLDLTPYPCHQCTEPVCMDACPASAIFVDDLTGARVVDEALCIGCSECIEACAKRFDLARLRLDADAQVVIKCDLCGGEPQCVRFCPIGAITYIVDDKGIETGFLGED